MATRAVARIFPGLRQKATRTRGVAVLVILHDLNLAAQYADSLVMLKGGRVMARGEPRSVLTREIIEETFAIPVIVTDHPLLDCPLVLPTKKDA